MSLSAAFESALMGLLFNNVAVANLGDAAGLRATTTAGNVYVALHTANPGSGGNQTTSEAAYTNYTRVAVARSSAAWLLAGSAPTQVSNLAAVTFPQSGSGPEIETYFSVGRDASGAGLILWSGVLTASLTVNNLVTPSFAIAQLIMNIL